MALLNPFRILENLRKFKYNRPFPISSIWPVNRRAAVLILLFVGNSGELRVLLTKRSRSLRSFSGHVALPGGKADSSTETFEQIARREAEEEIGLPQDKNVLENRYGMKLETISTEIPCYISQTFLSVKPVVCFLYNSEFDQKNEKYTKTLDASKFFGKLNPGETSSLFSVPLNDMVKHLFTDSSDIKPEYERRVHMSKNWGGLKWFIEHYYYPVLNTNEVSWLNTIEDLSSEDELEDGQQYRDLWGLTAKILSDVARIGNNIDSAKRRGHEGLIYGLYEFSDQFKDPKRSIWEQAMIAGKKGYYYSDVLPEHYIKKLQRDDVTF
ncbi:8-oxo-dGTP diphosphatase NDAI_0G02360 [Naumovozyma dairenensis CBS 421]|uniref:Nudix hydrolase domain-containing protein n=1 Tax=Naumovozyma dairenensis (strain ATCC 10597 / BCRC 20456 / CBS 421 / NBRC 0211 / NRRL Y-12639) TaxID=1071378 RepID=G0WE00_NAUDC|nr:hypothetical protein NDAI_0G02360 [Naumovozyma dairenensis CBS 421]CCD26011.2 hypothetical protein NDAI_0G02360 [Naumovozyma dairenensis CBS 421]